MAQRHTRRRRVRLNQRRIFLLPSRPGVVYLLVCLVLLLMGTNYQNNLVLAIAFLLLSLFVVAILHTYGNLAGLEIAAVRGYSCYAGEQAEFELRLSTLKGRSHESLQLRWPQQPVQSIDLIDVHESHIRVYHRAPRRGRLVPGALLVESHYPLGLLRAWSWLDLELEALIYPQPLEGGHLPAYHGAEGEGVLDRQSGSDDFVGFERYQPGMPPRRIAWKAYARGRGLHAKTYVASLERRIWLDWSLWPELDLEKRLSRLCYWTLQLSRSGLEYGLRLPGVEIQPGSGEAHREKVLAALALFPEGRS